VLLGGTTSSELVSLPDDSRTEARGGRPVTASNFRADVNANGSINSSDIGLVKARSGTALP